MVYTPRMSDDRVAAAQADLDQAFQRVVQSGFLKPAKPVPANQPRTCTQALGKTTKPVVVEKRAAPRFTPEQVRAKLAADEAQKKEKLMADATRKRQEDEAGRTLRNKTLPIERRIAAAEVLGFSITFRGPQDQPRKVIFRHSQTRERFTAMYPRGKNARRQMSQRWH